MIKNRQANFFLFLLWAVFSAMLAVLFLGFVHTPHIFTQVQLKPYFTGRFVLFAAGIFIIFLSFLILDRKRVHAYLLLSAIVVVMASVGLAPPVAVLVFLLSSLLIGDLLFIRSRSGPDLTDAALSVSAGAAFYAVIIGLMFHFKINYPFTYILLFAAPFIVNARGVQKYSARLKTFFSPLPYEIKTYPLLWLILFILAFDLMGVLLPEIGFDALVTHLAVPAFIFSNHSWNFDFHSRVWALMPMGGDSLYTGMYMLGGEYAARLLNFAAFLTGALLLYSAVRKWLSLNSALVVTALYISTPLFALECSTLYVENILVLFIFASVIALDRFMETGGKGYFYGVSMLLGAAVAIKFAALGAIPVIGMLAVHKVMSDKGRGKRLRTLLTGFAILAGAGSFAYIYSYWVTGNPVFPFMNSIFKSPFYDAQTSFRDARWVQPLSFSTLYHMTFSSHKFLESGNGALGFQYLLLLPVSLAAINKKNPRLFWIALATSLTFFPIVFKGVPYLRYITPVLPMFMVLIAAAMANIKRVNSFFNRSVMGACVILIILNTYFLPVAGWYNFQFDTRPVFRDDKRAEYIRNFAPERVVSEYLYVKYGDVARVGYLGRPFSIGFDGYTLTDDWHSPDFSNSLHSAKTEEGVEKIIGKYGLTHLVLDEDSQRNLPAPILDFVKQRTVKEFEAGDSYLARVADDVIFSREVLANGNFINGLDGWQRVGNVPYRPAPTSVEVNGGNFLVQPVPVDGDNIYLYSISARCDMPETHFLIRLNWADKRGRPVAEPVYAIKACTKEFSTYTKEFIPPAGAKSGSVCVAGWGNGNPVIVNSVSLKTFE